MNPRQKVYPDPWLHEEPRIHSSKECTFIENIFHDPIKQNMGERT
jgi:hypothetical protein